MDSYISQGKQLLMSTGFYQKKWYINKIEVIVLIYLRFHKNLFYNILQSFAACMSGFSRSLKLRSPHFSRPKQHSMYCWRKNHILVKLEGWSHKQKARSQILQIFVIFFLLRNFAIKYHIPIFAFIAKFRTILLRNFVIVLVREFFLLEDLC